GGFVEAGVYVPVAARVDGIAAQHVRGERAEIADAGLRVVPEASLGGDGAGEAEVEEAVCNAGGRNVGGASAGERSRGFGPLGGVPGVGAVIKGKRPAGAEIEDRRDFPSAEGAAQQAAPVAEPRKIPDAGDGDAVADIEIGVSAIKRRREGVEETKD